MEKSCLECAAGRIESRLAVAGVAGFDITILIQLLPMLLQLFDLCKKPIPPNPNANPTPAQQKAYELKYTATESYDDVYADYERALLHRTANQCRKAKKKDGERVSRADSVELARACLDEARTSDIDTIAKGIEEAQAA